MLAKAKYRKDYKQPDFTVTDIFLDFQLDPNYTVVTAKTTFQRLNDEATHLRLDGHDLPPLNSMAKISNIIIKTMKV